MIARASKAAVVACACAVVVLGGALPVHAATLSRDGARIAYTAAPGEANALKIGTFEGRIYFEDSRAVSATPGPGCDLGPNRAVPVPGCAAGGVTSVVVRLGDGNDETTARSQVMELQVPHGVKLDVDGGPGRDRLIGTKGGDKLAGGPGADGLYGSGGRDSLSGGSGNDRLTGFGTVSGGAGNDFIELFYGFSSSYTPFASRVSAGAGRDRVLSGNKVRDRIDCGSGRDRASSSDRRRTDRAKANCETRAS